VTNNVVVLVLVKPALLVLRSVHSHSGLHSLVNSCDLAYEMVFLRSTTHMIQVESVFLDCSNTCCDASHWNGIVCGKSTVAF
jgi:hypothetical protein